MVLIALSATRDEAVTNKTIKISPAPHPPTPRVVHHNPMPAQIGLIAIFITTRPTTERGDVVTDETYRDMELVFQLCIIQCSIQIIFFFFKIPAVSHRVSATVGSEGSGVQV